MKSIIIATLTMTLCLQLGWSLMCYYCPSETPSSQCTETKNCTRDNMVCKTIVESEEVGYPFDGTESVTRNCATLESCSQSNDDELGNAKPVFCCNTDLCNNRGLYANSTAVPTSPEIGKCIIGLSVALVITGL